jgi:hypothetical protein
MTRTVLLICMGLALAPQSARAMNWEGHDDWLEDHPAALAYEEKGVQPSRPPRTEPACPAQRGESHNPYEQIPLKPSSCAPEPPPETE